MQKELIAKNRPFTFCQPSFSENVNVTHIGGKLEAQDYKHVPLEAVFIPLQITLYELKGQEI